MPIYLTPKGKQKLEEELKELIAKRPMIAKRIEQAKEMGDLKENAEYHEAKDDQGLLESRIREVQATLNQAEIMEKGNGDVITLGSKITVEVNGNEKIYELVGANEASPLEGKISSQSPLGNAFLGHKKGESIQVKVPAGMTTYTIKEIE